MPKKLFTLLLAVAAGIGTMFASTKIGDLYYNLDATNQTAEVASNSSASGEIIIPTSVTYNAVEYSVTSIRWSAFEYCIGLTSVTIPGSVTSIGGWAFLECTSLTSVAIPNSVTSIGSYAFQGCSGLISVTISNSVTSIGVGAFAGCTGLTSIEIPNSVTSIGDFTFSDCTGFPIENNLRYADTYLIGVVDKSLSSYTIKEGTKWIGEYAFYDCTGLTSVEIPNSVTSIGYSAFRNCSGLTSVTIPNSVTSIGEQAFESCSGLTSITIPNSVTSIGDYAFQFCTGLTSVTNYASTPQSIDSYVFKNVNKSTCTLYVPEESVDAYKAAEGWKDFENIVGVDVPGEDPDVPSSAPAVYTNPANPAQKLIRNGNVYILTDDKTYTITGQKVK